LAKSTLTIFNDPRAQKQKDQSGNLYIPADRENTATEPLARAANMRPLT